MTYSIRPCRSLEDLSRATEIQKEVWGYAEREVYPLRLFVNLTGIGGHMLGAFSGEGRLVGFVAAMPAWQGRRRFYHSLSLAVLPGHENLGLGRALKLAQRRAAMRAGIARIEWTFDPLRAKNAYLNVQRLGVIVRRYLPDHYGRVESRLQMGLPSDRVVAEWWLKSARAKRAVAGEPPRSTERQPAAEVLIPADVGALFQSSPQEARAWQARVRKQLQAHFSRRLAITGFISDQKSGRYLLDRYEG